MKFAILLAFGITSTSICTAQLGPDEQAVWEREQAYWRFVDSNDKESYLELWDEEFIGWPRGSGNPTGVDNIADWMVPLHADPTTEPRHELKLEAIRAFGESIVVVHYLALRHYLDTDTGRRLPDSDTYVPARFTHTWRKMDGVWRIIAGMSADWKS
jgi:hypothetical protein